MSFFSSLPLRLLRLTIIFFHSSFIAPRKSVSPSLSFLSLHPPPFVLSSLALSLRPLRISLLFRSHSFISRTLRSLSFKPSFFAYKHTPSYLRLASSFSFSFSISFSVARPFCLVLVRSLASYLCTPLPPLRSTPT